jgi:hypothetical protein
VACLASLGTGEGKEGKILVACQGSTKDQKQPFFFILMEHEDSSASLTPLATF